MVYRFVVVAALREDLGHRFRLLCLRGAYGSFVAPRRLACGPRDGVAARVAAAEGQLWAASGATAERTVGCL